jgi:hypothetical protein
MTFKGKGAVEKLSVRAKLEDDHLADVTVGFDRHKTAVPTGQLNGIADPHLETFEVRYDGEDLTDMYLYCEYGVAPMRLSVMFHFKRGKYMGRLLEPGPLR